MFFLFRRVAWLREKVRRPSKNGADFAPVKTTADTAPPSGQNNSTAHVHSCVAIAGSPSVGVPKCPVNSGEYRQSGYGDTGDTPKNNFSDADVVEGFGAYRNTESAVPTAHNELGESATDRFAACRCARSGVFGRCNTVTLYPKTPGKTGIVLQCSSVTGRENEFLYL